MPDPKCPCCNSKDLMGVHSTVEDLAAYRCEKCSITIHLPAEKETLDMMLLDEYQHAAHETALPVCRTLAYPALKLAGEAGEVAEKVGKLYRDCNLPPDSTWDDVPDEKKTELVKELGDVLWYISEISTQLGVGLSVVAACNVRKLKSRHERGTLHGDGDNR